MEKSEIKAAIEAVLFASGTPVEAERIASALELDTATVKDCADELIDKYKKEKHGIKIVRINSGYQMCSDKEYGTYVRRVMDMKKNTPLSQAAMEVLAVIAYNQPVTKAFIEQIRGVDCSGVVSSLCLKGLIEEKGRLELPGKPLLYGTTDRFLHCFGLENLEGLPTVETKKQESENTEEAPEAENAENTENAAEDKNDNT